MRIDQICGEGDRSLDVERLASQHPLADLARDADHCRGEVLDVNAQCRIPLHDELD